MKSKSFWSIYIYTASLFTLFNWRVKSNNLTPRIKLPQSSPTDRRLCNNHHNYAFCVHFWSLHPFLCSLVLSIAPLNTITNQIKKHKRFVSKKQYRFLLEDKLLICNFKQRLISCTSFSHYFFIKSQGLSVIQGENYTKASRALHLKDQGWNCGNHSLSGLFWLAFLTKTTYYLWFEPFTFFSSPLFLTFHSFIWLCCWCMLIFVMVASNFISWRLGCVP